jgi:hypothetical protein
MSRCLNDARIQAAADGEATAIERQHLEGCAECGARAGAAHRAVDEFAAMASRVSVPANLGDRLERALTTDHARAGATTLRDLPTSPWGARLWLTAGVVVTAVLAVVFLLPPLDTPRTLSAAQILDRSLQTMSPASGTELREFDLDLRLPRIVAKHAGTYRIEQLVDHDEPGRYRLVRYSPDGTVLDAISEEPAAGRRTAVVRSNGQTFVFRFTTDPAHALGLRELERTHVEAVIRVLQAAAGQTVREVDTGRGRRYVVELPQVADSGATGFWELSGARVVIDAVDFQLLELTAAGSYMSEPFSVSFQLRRRNVRPSAEVSPDQFQIPLDPDAIVIEGPGTTDVGQDVLASALRELVRSRQR